MEYYKDDNVRLLCGDSLELIKEIPDNSIACCITSPPYYGLRDYGINNQIGCEETPTEYIRKLNLLFEEVKRVLKEDGTLWVNIGDSYVSKPTGSLGNSTGKEYGFSENHKHQVAGSKRIDKTGFGLPEKNLIGIPWRLAFKLQDSGWYLRQDIVWEKINPMPESVKDRFTKAHEYLFLLSKNKSYLFNHSAVREQVSERRVERDLFGNEIVVDETTRTKRSVWSIPLEPLKEDHVAPFPTKLVEPCVLAGSNEGDTVLDVFNGAGTTGLVALKNNRKYLGLELNPKYLDITKKRLGLGDSLLN